MLKYEKARLIENIRKATAIDVTEAMYRIGVKEALCQSELLRIMKHSGLELEFLGSREIKVDLQSWMGLTQTPPEIKEKITQNLSTELSGGLPTGMRPFVEEGKIKFLQTWVVVVSGKVS